MTKLPTDCRLAFHPHFLTLAEERAIYAHLDGLPELKRLTTMMADGTERPVALGSFMLGDDDVLGYDKLHATWGGRGPWPACLQPVKGRIEAIAGRTYQVARCVYYADGNAGVDYHTDPPAYGDTSVIASLSLGERRTFSLRSLEQPERRYNVDLPSGSLFIMGEGCQDRYEHALLPDPERAGPRFNLTFRQFGSGR